MLAIKIILQIAMAISGFLTIYIEHKWKDRRTKLYKRGLRVLISSMFGILCLSVYITTKDHNSNETEKRNLETSINEFQDKLSTANNSLNEIKTQFEPIASLAREKFPNLSETDAINNLKEDLGILNRQVAQNSQYNRLDMESKKPELTLIPNVLEWKKKTDDESNFNYQIQFKIGNIGKRTAHKVHEKIIMFFFNKKMELTHRFEPTNLLGDNFIIPVGHEGERLTGIITFAKPIEEIMDDGDVFVFIKYTYHDSLLGLDEKYQNVFVWHGFQRDGLKIKLARQEEYDFIVQSHINN